MVSRPARRTPAPGRHVYDAIVIGGQLSGALTAALLARGGLHVLLAPHDGLSAPYAHGEWRLPHAPFLMPPLKALPALEEQLLALGITTNVHRLLRAPALQLLEPGRRFERSPDDAARAKELARALGDGAEAFEATWAGAAGAAATSDAFFASKPDLPPEGLLGRWRFKRLVARADGLDADTPLGEASPLRALLPWAAPVAGAGPLTRARALGHLLAGPTVLPGGAEGLTTLVQERARELGADVLAADEAVAALVFEGAAPAGVRLGRGDTIYRAPALIAACDLSAFTRLVPEERRRSSAAALTRVGASRAVFTLNVVLPEAALPRGLGELALVSAAGLEGGAALLQVTAAFTTGEVEHPDKRVLTVGTVAPLALRAGGEPAVRAFIDGLWAALDDVLPFTRAHALLESTPWLDVPSVAEGSLTPHPLLELPDDAWLGVAALQTSSPWKRLLLASREVLPGLGLEGEALAAARAVRAVEARLKKNDPLRGRRPG